MILKHNACKKKFDTCLKFAKFLFSVSENYSWDPPFKVNLQITSGKYREIIIPKTSFQMEKKSFALQFSRNLNHNLSYFNYNMIIYFLQ